MTAEQLLNGVAFLALIYLVWLSNHNKPATFIQSLLIVGALLFLESVLL